MGYEIAGAQPAADRLILGAGLSMEFANSLSVRLGYDGLLSENQQTHAGSITASGAF